MNIRSNGCNPKTVSRTQKNKNPVQNYRLLILFPVIVRCNVDLNRVVFSSRSFRCLVVRPLVRLRHIAKLLAFMFARMSSITSFSESPNCISIASKGVRSSHAISMIRSISAAERLCVAEAFIIKSGMCLAGRLIVAAPVAAVPDFLPYFLPLFAPGKWSRANHADFRRKVQFFMHLTTPCNS
jgi:hypothetical protein